MLALARRHEAALRQLLTFGVGGVLGFLVDTAVLYTAMAAGAGPYSGRVLSYLVAATSTWQFNRNVTFRARRDSNWAAEWGRFLLANAVGGLLNYGTYAALIAGVGIVREHPILGIAAGSLAGLAANFTLSRSVVFRGPR